MLNAINELEGVAEDQAFFIFLNFLNNNFVVII